MDAKSHRMAWMKYLDAWLSGEIDHVAFLAREISLQAGCLWEDLEEADRQSIMVIAQDAMQANGNG